MRTQCCLLGLGDRFEEPFPTALHAYTHHVAAVETMSAPILLCAFKEHRKDTAIHGEIIPGCDHRWTVPDDGQGTPRQQLLLSPPANHHMFKKIGIIREGKQPPDRRVPLTPKQCHEAMLQGIDIAVQRSPVRAYTDAEYTAQAVRCLLYTSDAADERTSVDLGGPRSIQKKKKKQMNMSKK